MKNNTKTICTHFVRIEAPLSAGFIMVLSRWDGIFSRTATQPLTAHQRYGREIVTIVNGPWRQYSFRPLLQHIAGAPLPPSAFQGIFRLSPRDAQRRAGNLLADSIILTYRAASLSASAGAACDITRRASPLRSSSYSNCRRKRHSAVQPLQQATKSRIFLPDIRFLLFSTRPEDKKATSPARAQPAAVHGAP